MVSKEIHDFGLEDLKKEYEKLRQSYNLPEFSVLNEIFDIEEVDVETEFLLRKIRRNISDKIAGYIRFIEAMINPTNAPLFLYKLIKKLEEDDKKVLTNIYETLGDFEVELIILDLNYNEQKEAEFINRMFKVFNEQVRRIFLDVLKRLSNGGDKRKESSSSYCG